MAGGVLLVLAVALDVFRTVLLPASSGSASRGQSTALWRVCALCPGGPARRRSG